MTKIRRRCLAALALGILLALPASGSGPGLYAEQSISVDGVTVRRVRDSREGVVCYVAIGAGRSDAYGRPSSVSCLRELAK